MTVVAKFFLQEKDVHEDAPTASRLVFGAVCRGRENASWAAATPGGRIELGILNDAATAYFEKGAEYLVTFERVEPPRPGDGHAPLPVAFHGGRQDSMCATCGTNAMRNPETGELDWWVHDRLFNDDVTTSKEESDAYMEEHGLVWAWS